MKIAKQANVKRNAGGGLIQYWWVAAAVVFVAMTFTVGPLKPKVNADREQATPKTPVATAEIAVKSALVNAFDGFCKNPAGGMIAPGDIVYITDGEQIKHVRCNNGSFTEEKEIP